MVEELGDTPEISLEYTNNKVTDLCLMLILKLPRNTNQLHYCTREPLILPKATITKYIFSAFISMEGSDTPRVDAQRVSSGFNMWRSHCMGVFSTSEREEDEATLKCVAIERLLAKARIIRRRDLNQVEGKEEEVDIKQLELSERKSLLERLVKIPEEENERFLLKLKERMDRVGLEIPTIEVRFEHLNVEAQVYAGSRAFPTLINFFVNLLEGFLNSLHTIRSPKKPLHILQNVSGIIKPRR
ncbi:hypothetical protein JHK82_048317 [Glycine max]|nr:hypothetical protein JHK86_048185 [Glycine max]KAG5098463.1 hypothetical protein JHK82_048317 [Glycine max]KAG5103251.1 hypothetical protein JHK84_048220 [Glycine max]